MYSLKKRVIFCSDDKLVKSLGNVFFNTGGIESSSPPEGDMTDAQEHKKIIDNK